MINEATHLKKITAAVHFDSKSDKTDNQDSSTNQYHFFIVTGSFLALLALIVVAANRVPSYYETVGGAGAGALVDYQVNTANSVLAMDIFGISASYDNERDWPTCTYHCPNIYCPDDHCPNGCSCVYGG